MKYTIRITSQAERDMDDAANYIRLTLKNSEAAYQLLIKAGNEIGSLGEFPQRNQLVDDPVLSSWGIRFISINKYLAFYVIAEEEKTINIIRFLYGKSDWLSVLKQGFSME